MSALINSVNDFFNIHINALFKMLVQETQSECNINLRNTIRM